MDTELLILRIVASLNLARTDGTYAERFKNAVQAVVRAGEVKRYSLSRYGGAGKIVADVMSELNIPLGEKNEI